MRTSRAVACVIAAVAVAILSTTISAAAAVVLEFSPSAAIVGHRVAGASDVGGVPVPDGTNLKIFLAPSQRIADRVQGPRDPRLARFGLLRIDEEGVGRFSGKVPDVAPGDHVAVAYCRICKPGGSTFTVGEFTVSKATLPTTGSSSFGLVSLAVLSLGCGVFFVWFRSAPPSGGTPA